MMFLHFLFGTGISTAAPVVDSVSVAKAAEFVSQSNIQTPHGRLQIAINIFEDGASDSVILALGNTHPHIALMLTDPVSVGILDYISVLPSSTKNKIRKGDGIIRKSEEMSKSEKKKLATIAKQLGTSKNVEAIRLSSFDGIHMNLELSYKYQGKMTRKEFTFALPFAPVSAQEARNDIETTLGTKPVPPTDGAYSLMPFNNASFEYQMDDWFTGIGYKFENEKPVGTLIVDTDQTMDGKSALKFYNTEETMVFPNISQTIPVGSTYKVQFQCFVKSKNTRLEYRQDADYSLIKLNYLDADGDSIKEDQQLLRLGTYDWESLIIDSFVPHDATNLVLTLGSSVSGTFWIDGLSLIRQE